jgi:hypothetical protein
LPLRDVRAVYSGGLHADQDFVRLGRRHRSGGQTEHLGSAGAVGLDEMHGLRDGHGDTFGLDR